MPNEIRIGTGLSCGCCGEFFYTWDGYVDQDQDLDYGICASCQESNEEHAEAEYDKLIDCIKTGLRPASLCQFEKKTRNEQKAFALHCLNKGIITLSFGAV